MGAFGTIIEPLSLHQFPQRTFLFTQSSERWKLARFNWACLAKIDSALRRGYKWITPSSWSPTCTNENEKESMQQVWSKDTDTLRESGAPKEQALPTLQGLCLVHVRNVNSLIAEFREKRVYNKHGCGVLTDLLASKCFTVFQCASSKGLDWLDIGHKSCKAHSGELRGILPITQKKPGKALK